MLKKNTVIWMTCIMYLLVMSTIEFGHGIAMIALVWMVPALLMFTFMFLTQDWRKDNA